MKCTTAICSKNTQPFSLDTETAIIPAECEIGEVRKLCAYFQYRAPNIDAAQSPMLDATYHSAIIDSITNGKNEFAFCAQNANTNTELAKVALAGIVLCSRCKRFLCKRMTKAAKRDPSRAETDLECLLRHLRNAIAHGHVYLHHGGNFISLLFEDKNDKGNTTARIICCQADLKKWKKLLEDYILNSNTLH